MSWSVTAVGRAKAVADKVAKDIASSRCVEPEETIKNQAGAIVALALSGFPEDAAVRVEMSGSQWVNDGKAHNSLSVKLEPLYGFVG